MVLNQDEEAIGDVAAVSFRLTGAQDDVARFAHPITRMLLTGDGLTTPMLEALRDRTLSVRVLRQDIVPAGQLRGAASEALCPSDADELVVRRSCLVDRDAVPVSVNYVVALRHRARQWGVDDPTDTDADDVLAIDDWDDEIAARRHGRADLTAALPCDGQHAAHQPTWPDPAALWRAVNRLESLPPLVSAAECDVLTADPGAAAQGRAFVLHLGDCAETFDFCDASALLNRQALAAATVVSFGTGLRPVVLGRPDRMLRAYFHAAATLNHLDQARLDRLIGLAVTRNPAEIAARVVPDLAYFLTARCTFGHAALLVFPTGQPELLAALAERGFRCSPLVPSTVVRDRLRERCGLAEAPPVQIVHARTTIPDGSTRELEIFLAPGGLVEVATRERIEETESHLAFVPDDPADDRVREVCDALLGDGLLRDGGGFNPHENVTTLYFRRPRPTGFVYRLELACPGWYPELLAEHLADNAAALPAPTRPVGAR